MAIVDTEGFQAMKPGPYQARSASDNRHDWPFWFVADKNGHNILGGTGHGAVLTDRSTAEHLANKWNLDSTND